MEKQWQVRLLDFNPFKQAIPDLTRVSLPEHSMHAWEKLWRGHLNVCLLWWKAANSGAHSVWGESGDGCGLYLLCLSSQAADSTDQCCLIVLHYGPRAWSLMAHLCPWLQILAWSDSNAEQIAPACLKCQWVTESLPAANWWNLWGPTLSGWARLLFSVNTRHWENLDSLVLVCNGVFTHNYW